MKKKDVVHIYNGIFLSHKKDTIESVQVRKMTLEPVTESEASRKRKADIDAHSDTHGV